MRLVTVSALAAILALPLYAQETDESAEATETEAVDAAAEEQADATEAAEAGEDSGDGTGGSDEGGGDGGEDSAETLLTDEELQTLVAPVALFPDTLLIQVFVAATQPLEVVKVERYLIDNADRAPEELKPEIEAMELDPSVEVLATAFPDVIGQMATHIDWTETMGVAMLAQSDDVMDAVQVMRNQAIDSGALVSGEEQTVDVAEDDTVVITPTDPEVVYVPQYVPTEVYSDNSGDDVVGTVLLTFGTVALINEIFDDDDDWYHYWGCGYCGGWNGYPIIRNPDIDIDIDGDVNIGDGDFDWDNRPDIDWDNRPDIGWKPDPDRADEARDKIADRDPDALPGQGKLPVERPEGRTDELRNKLSDKTGAADITRDAAARENLANTALGVGAGAAAGAAIAKGSKNLPKIDKGGNRDAKDRAVDKTREKPAAAKPKAQPKPKVASKPKAPKQPVSRAPKAQPKKPSGMHKKAGGQRVNKAHAKRGGAKAKRRR